MAPVTVSPTQVGYTEPDLALRITLQSTDTDQGAAVFRVESAVGLWWLGQQGYLLLQVLVDGVSQGGVGEILTPNANVEMVALCGGLQDCRNLLRIIPGAPDPSAAGGVDVTVPAALPGSDLRVTYQLDGGALDIETRAIVPEPGSVALLAFGLAVLGMRRRVTPRA